MNKINVNSPAVQEAVTLLKDNSVSVEQKLSYLQDWEWDLNEIIELALIAGD